MKRLITTLASIPFLVLFFWFNYIHAQGTKGVEIGDAAPEFELKDVSGEMVSMNTYPDAKGYILTFTCNHCPYSKLYEDRLIALHDAYAPQGWPVIAINPNDAEQYPDDSYENMKKRAVEKGFTFPYLLDDSQTIAQAYGATRTPHLFLVKNDPDEGDRTVEYIGALDDNAKAADDVEEKWLENAIDALEKGERPDPATTKAVGCSIKWKKS